MDDKLDRLANTLIEGIHCSNCGTPLSIESSEMEAKDEGVYRYDYSCNGCEAEYAITVEEEKAILRVEYTRTDDNAPEELITPFKSSRKEGLQRQSHPAKDLVERYRELNAALTLLWQNRNRILHECNTLREKGSSRTDEEFHRRVHADMHNYVASAYTFDEILQNVESTLPTDGPVEDALKSYKEHKKVINGLRVYAQHQFTLPVSYINLFGEDEEIKQTIGVKLNEVNEIESHVERNPPDGYALGASDHHYEKIEGEYINFERRVNFHYEAAEELVATIADHTEDVHEDEIEDYRESVRYTAERDPE